MHSFWGPQKKNSLLSDQQVIYSNDWLLLVWLEKIRLISKVPLGVVYCLWMTPFCPIRNGSLEIKRRSIWNGSYNDSKWENWVASWLLVRSSNRILDWQSCLKIVYFADSAVPIGVQFLVGFFNISSELNITSASCILAWNGWVFFIFVYSLY